MIMKKQLLLAGAVLASIQGANAASKSFDGFYAGLQAALNNSKTKSSIIDPDTVTTIKSLGGSSSGSKSATGFLYGLYAGYGRNLNGFYVGGEVSISGDSTTRKANAASMKIGEVLRTVSARYKRGMILGLTPRFGYVFGENLVYIKTGLEISGDKAKITSFATGSGKTNEGTTLSAKKTNVVFTPGIGYERAMANLLLRAEYTYNAGTKMTIKDDTKRVGETSYSDNRLAFGVAYKF